MVEGDEKELLERAKAGDIAAFGALFQRGSSLIEGKVRKLFPKKQDVEDVLQETFLRGYLGITSFHGNSKLSSWLCEIAINFCRDQFRKEQAHPHETMDGSFPEEHVRFPHENPQGGRTKRGGRIERFSAFSAGLNEADRRLQQQELEEILHIVLESQLEPHEANAIKLVHFQAKRKPAGEAAVTLGFSKRTKIYEITRKYVDLCLKARGKMLRSKKTVQPVERSP